jgi:hypothetical protein
MLWGLWWEPPRDSLTLVLVGSRRLAGMARGLHYGAAIVASATPPGPVTPQVLNSGFTQTLHTNLAICIHAGIYGYVHTCEFWGTCLKMFYSSNEAKAILVKLFLYFNLA